MTETSSFSLRDLPGPSEGQLLVCSQPIGTESFLNEVVENHPGLFLCAPEVRGEIRGVLESAIQDCRTLLTSGGVVDRKGNIVLQGEAIDTTLTYGSTQLAHIRTVSLLSTKGIIDGTQGQLEQRGVILHGLYPLSPLHKFTVFIEALANTLRYDPINNSYTILSRTQPTKWRDFGGNRSEIVTALAHLIDQRIQTHLPFLSQRLFRSRELVFQIFTDLWIDLETKLEAAGIEP